MGTVTPIRGKTEQRVTQVISILQDAEHALSYEEIRLKSGARTKGNGSPGILYGGVAYDQLLYILSTLIEVGLVERLEETERRQGRPRIFFRWKAQPKVARASGAR